MTKSLHGLTSKEAKKRLETDGYNILDAGDDKKWYTVFFAQLKNLLIWILAFAALFSYFADKIITLYFILGIVLIIIVTGFLQEYKAEKAMSKLKKMSSSKTHVYRDGKLKEIPTENVVPGDHIRLERGDKIPADATILKTTNLEIDEAILTGESLSVKKKVDDKVFSGTTVVNGRGEALVKNTGMNTELGIIADEVSEDEEKTPLQKRVDILAKRLAIIAVLACSFIFALGWGQGEPVNEVMIVALSLVVATVPEALPLTLTLTLSTGMRDMAKKNVVVKKMLAVESLGSTTTICTDKTGTLTRNEMTVKKIFYNNNIGKVTGTGYIPKGHVKIKNKTITTKDKTFKKFLEICQHCNNAELDKEEGEHIVIGDPTEGALKVLANKYDMNQDTYKREHEILFTSKRKMMTTINKKNKSYQAFTKGAPEILLNKCNKILINGKTKKLTQKNKEEILKQNEEFAKQALRVLGLAYKPKVKNPEKEKDIEKNLIFVGLAGMIDPPRHGVKESIEECKSAGINVKMVTGDNPLTAKAIAKELNLTTNDKVLLGDDIEKMSHEELVKIVKTVDIYARTHPKHKHDIVKALQENGEVVAMTGDGINDAPAVKAADVGIGMGKKGTDVTREASDIVLKDDSFHSIVSAIKEGRRIYDNIEKFTVYLLSRNFTEVLLIALGIILLGFEYIPLIALQILFINVIGEELPALSLGMDPAGKDIMKKPPKDPKRKLLNSRNTFLVGTIAVFMAFTAYLVFWYTDPFADLQLARTVTFSTIVLMVAVHAFNFRSLTESLFKINVLENKLLVLSAFVVTPLLIATIYWAPAANIFEHVDMISRDWYIAAFGAIATLIFIEIVKHFGRHWYHNKNDDLLSKETA